MSVPPDVAVALDQFVGGVRTALGGGVVGAYVVGSLALGCADEWSDVDVIVVVQSPPDDASLELLRPLHTGLLGGSYAVAADLRSPMTLGRRWWYADNGSRDLVLSDHDNTAHTRWVLRERGVVLHGPDPRDLVAEVTADALRAEALGLARARAEELEDDPAAYDDGWAAIVLTSCRTVHTARRAEVVGKGAAARWALEHLPAVHRPLIEAAIADWSHRTAAPRLVSPTRALVWDVVRLAGEAALDARG